MIEMAKAHQGILSAVARFSGSLLNRRFIAIAGSAAMIAGLGVGLAPTAMAVPNTVVISSFDNGPVGVSGTVTFTPAAGARSLSLTVGFPSSEYSTGFSGSCVDNGITASINGTPLVVACGTGTEGAFNTIIVRNYWSSGPVTTSDVITMTWGATAATRTGTGSASSFGVSADVGAGPSFTMVTPSLTGSSPSSSGSSDSGPDLTMWYQSIGRHSSDSACPSGYAGSWAQWPNGQQGGWVCNREIFAYQPNPGE
jgi:hypothetical protein